MPRHREIKEGTVLGICKQLEIARPQGASLIVCDLFLGTNENENLVLAQNSQLVADLEAAGFARLLGLVADASLTFSC